MNENTTATTAATAAGNDSNELLWSMPTGVNWKGERHVVWHNIWIPVSLIEEIVERLRQKNLQFERVLGLRFQSWEHWISVSVRTEEGDRGRVKFNVLGCDHRPIQKRLGACLRETIPRVHKTQEEEAPETGSSEDDFSWWVSLHFDDLQRLEEQADPKTHTFVIPKEMTKGIRPSALIEILQRDAAKYQGIAVREDGSVLVQLGQPILDEELLDIAEELGY